MRLRANEKMAPDVVTKVSSEMSCEVVAAYVVCARKTTAVQDAVEPQIFTANSCHDIATKALPEL